MKSSFRWYGESDPVTLDEIRQIPGMRSIVSAVYDVKPGEVWPEESIKRLADQCAAHGLVFDVVESIPVTEEIKLGRPERDRHIANYCESIRRCAKYGVKCVTYNFMPVFDWTRTQLDKAAADGSTSLVMYWEQMKGLDPSRTTSICPAGIPATRRTRSGSSSAPTASWARRACGPTLNTSSGGSSPWPRSAAWSWPCIRTIPRTPSSACPGW